MQITDMSVNVVDVGQGFSWGGRMAMEVVGIFVAIEADTGLEGHALAWTAELPAAAAARAIELAIKPHVLGADPLDRPRILSPAWRGFRVGLPLAAIGVVDVALWDLAGKAAGVSISELLGRRRDRIKACASAPPCDSAADCEAMVDELVADGFRAVKLHACGDVRIDIAACHAARKTVGDDVELMMDAMAIYTRSEALILARALDDLGFRWFEDPLPDDDLDGWIALRSRIETPLAGVDGLRFTVRDYARPAADGAFDILRMDAARHGISQLQALGELADSFGLGCEGHAFGPALAQAANLQVGLAAGSTRYCELPVPLGALDLGVERGLALDTEGFVVAPTGPGLGLAVDRDAIAAATPR
jgi:L-alanine-DL-glutamate epimerase-like enolase superfamily enzyme